MRNWVYLHLLLVLLEIIGRWASRIDPGVTVVSLSDLPSIGNLLRCQVQLFDLGVGPLEHPFGSAHFGPLFELALGIHLVAGLEDVGATLRCHVVVLVLKTHFFGVLVYRNL